jgi:hypothetical protein
MGTYKVLRPLKNRGRWFSIGSVCELDDEEGKALESSELVIKLSVDAMADSADKHEGQEISTVLEAPEVLETEETAPETEEITQEAEETAPEAEEGEIIQTNVPEAPKPVIRGGRRARKK